MKNYNDIYIETRRALRAAGVEASELEARLLLAAAADKSPAEFLRDIRMYPGPGFEERAAINLERRLRGEPAAYITSSWSFMGLELEINPNVLSPRSDTELLAQAGIDFLREREEARVLDLCTGSGCIGLAIAAALPHARVLLTDIDGRALLLAKRNALHCGLSQRCMCLEADVMKAPARQLGSFDLITCNPPYIPSAEIDTLDVSVRDYEPHSALDGGEDGLDFYRSLFARWTGILKPGGCLALECGEGQSEELRRMAAETGLLHRETLVDTLGTERTLLFTRSEA